MTYTKSGDVGTTTTLKNPQRLPKNHPLIAALGSIDELNSHLGLATSLLQQSNTIKTDHRQLTTDNLTNVQKTLFSIGTLLQNAHQQNLPNKQLSDLDQATHQLEQLTQKLSQTLPSLKKFILPGGHPIAAQVHLARAVCRRTERTVAQLKSPSQIIAYLNRLSDYLFILARFINHESQVPEVTPP
jgi:cob(I)alamin adenosyltransferase